MKKLFLTLFALLMAIPSLWAEDFSVGGIYYDITSSTNKTVEVTHRGNCYQDYSNEYSGSVTIPSSVTYNGTTYSVTSIGYAAFRACTGLTEVTIPESVTSIGDYAFYDCTGLTSITIPNSVTSIGWQVFRGCTNLTSVTIPNSVISIDEYAFYNCTGLTSVTIPESVTSIGRDAFYNTPWYNNNQPDGVIYINKVLYDYKGTMPENTSIEIKEGTLSISPYAFYDCTGLISITIPNSVTEIGSYAFLDCTSLTTVHFNATNCTTMGSSVYSVFSRCTNLATVTIGENVTCIPDYAFYNCTGLTSVTIGNGVTEIGESAFRDCTGLTTVHFNATNCTSMGEYSYNYNNYYPVFRDCTNLTTVHIGENVTCIPDYAFYECTGLTSVTIGNSVTEIGEKAFSGCSGMSEIHTLATTPPKATSLSFENCYAAHLYVPKGYKNAYQQANVWRIFNSIGSYRYTVTVNPSDESMGSVSGSGIYWDEQVVALIASANEGYEFLQWSDGNTDNPRTVIVMNDLTLTAQFIAEGSGPASYQVILQPNNNELGSVMGAGTYQENEEATLIAIPQSGILFTQWSDGNTDNPRVLTVTEDITLTAQFAQPEENIEEDYQVTILSNNEMLGSVTQVRAVIIEAISTESGKFVIWSDGNSDNPRTLYPTEDITLTAIFSEASTIEGIADSNIKLYTTNEALHIENAPAGEQVMISDLSGRNVKVENVEAGSHRIALESGIYLVRIANRVVKVVV